MPRRLVRGAFFVGLPRAQRYTRAALSKLAALPIDPVLPEVVRAITEQRAVVLQAAPGAGKTTRVPRALYDAGIAESGEIVVLEPRRLAARLSARRVAEELGQEAGGVVGYQMRFEDKTSAETRVRFVTEGLLTRRLTQDKTLRGVSCVLLDEFHERHLVGDVALALLRKIQLDSRPDLAIGVMSATIDAAPIAAFLGNAPIVRSEGRQFEVAIEHLPQSDDRPLEKQVASAVRALVDDGLDGDVLVFLPGGLEIRRATDALAPIATKAGLLVLPLYGSLSPAEQDRAVRPADRRKVILSTNVAETSVTIDGVVAVVDSGLARVASHAPWSGLPTLKLAKVSRASATQRAGRAGRTRPGRCIRLYTRGDFEARPAFDAPEIARADLAETALDLRAAGVGSPAAFAFLDAPPKASLDAADELLGRLGAIDQGGAMTELGRAMQRLPLHPRLSRLVIEADRRGAGTSGAIVASLIAERDVSSRRGRDASHRSDVLALLERYEGNDLERERADAVRRAQQQLRRFVARDRDLHPDAMDEALSIAILAGFGDRVGRLRRPDAATGRAAREIVFAFGGTAVLAESSGVSNVDLVVAVDIEERSEGRAGRVQVRLASAIEQDWLLDLFTDQIVDATVASWNASAERVEVARRLSYGALVLEEKRDLKPRPGPEVARALLEAARSAGISRFVDAEGLESLARRVAFARKACPELGLPAIDASALDQALADACASSTSFADLRGADLASIVRASIAPDQMRRLDEAAPESFTLPGGRRLKLTYPDGESPFAASRLQDFFGMKDGPRVAKGRVPVVLQLLAPNQRAVQITTDLAGFWSRHYPSIAKELRRKYPRHPWPDDPLTAAPPAPKR